MNEPKFTISIDEDVVRNILSRAYNYVFSNGEWQQLDTRVEEDIYPFIRKIIEKIIEESLAYKKAQKIIEEYEKYYGRNTPN